MNGLQLLEAEFSVLRMCAWGLSLVLAWLLWCRSWDYHTGRHLNPDQRNVQYMGPKLVMAGALLLAATNILAFTLPIFEGYVRWMHDVRAPTLLSFVTLIALLVLFIDRLAYKRADKWLWVISWVGFVHLSKWGAVWLTATS